MIEKSHLPSQTYSSVSLVDQFVAALDDSDDRSLFDYTIGSMDQQLYDYYADVNYRSNSISRELYRQPSQRNPKLQMPQQNSLTDSLMRTTLGCEDNLVKSYVQMMEEKGSESVEKKKRAEEAKKKFAGSNTHKDFCANSKPFMNTVRFALQRPVIDSEHDSYLKTQLIFLEQPKGTTLNTKEYFDRHTDLIAKKINELGGMQDTIARMEDSLSKNEVKSFKKKQVLAAMNLDRKNLFSPPKQPLRNDSRLRESWINRSKQMRESFMTKFQIE